MAVAPCNSLKTLTIAYSTESITPSGGYTVKWRAVGDDIWHLEPNKRANPIVISGVPSCYPLEVQLLVDCGTGLQVVETFGVQGSGGSSCYSFDLLDTGQYTYTPCGSTNSVSIYNTTSVDVLSANQNICAVDGSVSGGRYSRKDQCLGTQA